MNRFRLTFSGYVFFIWLVFTLFPLTPVPAQERRVLITEPKTGAVFTNPFKVCMSVDGLILEPADLGVREGHGHHHVVFSSLPLDLSKPLKRRRAIHLDKAQSCVKLKLEPGNHVIIAIFAYADHIPYNPLIMDKILIRVKQAGSLAD